jgi:hypothetical protein
MFTHEVSFSVTDIGMSCRRLDTDFLLLFYPQTHLWVPLLLPLWVSGRADMRLRQLSLRDRLFVCFGRQGVSGGDIA